jgi:hypothetical protein
VEHLIEDDGPELPSRDRFAFGVSGSEPTKRGFLQSVDNGMAYEDHSGDLPNEPEAGEDIGGHSVRHGVLQMREGPELLLCGRIAVSLKPEIGHKVCRHDCKQNRFRVDFDVHDLGCRH